MRKNPQRWQFRNRHLKFTLAVTAMFATGMAAVGASAGAAPAERSGSAVLTIPPPFPPQVVGSSSLVRTDRGMSLNVHTSGLERGHAVTLWLIVANDPAECEQGIPGVSQCGPADHVAGRGQMSIHHGAGRIAAKNGTASYGTHLRIGDTSRALFEGEPGLLDPRNAELIAVLKTHGPALPGLVSDQLRTFGGGCADQSTPPALTPRPGMLGRPGGNDCAEIQFSVHRAGG